MNLIKVILIFLIISKASLAQDLNQEKSTNSPIIVASINPIYQILLEITKDKENTILIIKPNISEHSYQLKKDDIAAIYKANLLFYVDDNLEYNFPKLAKNRAKDNKISYQLSKIDGLNLIMRKNNSKRIDPHIWLNPQNAIKIAEFITKEIIKIDVKNSKKYQENFAKFKEKILSLEQEITKKISKINSLNYVIFTSDYQYFEEYFALKSIKIINVGHDQNLTIKDLKEFDKIAKSNKINCIFGDFYDESNISKKLAKKYNINFITLNLIGEGNYFKLLSDLSNNISSCN